ncbi:MAG: thioredoxin family protein, partial [Spirochaetota bacterium]
PMLSIKVLGGGCKNCHALEERAKEAIEELKLDGNVSLVTDKDKIVSYGVAMTPALVINEEVVSAGKVLSKDKIMDLIKKRG